MPARLPSVALALLVVLAPLVAADTGSAPAATPPGGVSVRTERYPRPPYSEATYYVYERNGAPVCTKLAVCNKFDDCTTFYHRGPFKAPEDLATGAPYGTTPAAPIAPGKLGRHACLTRYGLARP